MKSKSNFRFRYHGPNGRRNCCYEVNFHFRRSVWWSATYQYISYIRGMLCISKTAEEFRMEFPLNGPHKNTFGIFFNWNCNDIFPSLTCDPLGVKISKNATPIIQHCTMGKPKTSIIWKTSDSREKRNEIWDARALFQHIWGTSDFAAFQVIWGSFVALVSFQLIQFSERCFFYI